MDSGFFDHQGLSLLLSMEWLEEALHLTLVVFQFHDSSRHVSSIFLQGMVQLFLSLALFSCQCLTDGL